jgi:hypothetical protein
LEGRFLQLHIMMPQILKKSRPEKCPVKDQWKTGIINRQRLDSPSGISLDSKG